jgi:hypothetical protein
LLFVICDLDFFTVTKKFISRSNWVLAASGRAEGLTWNLGCILSRRSRQSRHFKNNTSLQWFPPTATGQSFDVYHIAVSSRQGDAAATEQLFSLYRPLGLALK